MAYLKESLERSRAPGILVHSAQSNMGKTHDGVAKGGERLAREVGGRWSVKASLCFSPFVTLVVLDILTITDKRTKHETHTIYFRIAS